VRPVKATLVATTVAEEPIAPEVPAIAKAKPVAKPTVVEEPAVAATPVVSEAPAVAETPAKADNLELIEGIGPKIAAALTAAGIVTFADLAAADTSRLAEILQQEPNLRSADPGTWSEQAALAAAGKWDEFKALTEQLKGGRRA
jgi:predicted flap endonuclease-1-like 5' DNA nuclease